MFNTKKLFEKLTSAWPIGAKIRERINALFTKVYQQPAPVRPAFSQSHYSFNTLQTNLKPVGNKMVLLRVVLAKLFKNPLIEQLIQTAFAGKPFTVEFVPLDTLYSEGECNFDTKTIRIGKNQSLSVIVSTLIFELCNASNINLGKISINQFNSAESYALAMEKAEYLTYEQHVKLLKSLLLDNDFIGTLEGVGESSADLKNEICHAFKSFDEYWHGANTQQSAKDFTHSEYYRRHFEDFAKLNGYFRKQPMLVPGFHGEQKSTSILALQFHSKEAKELFATISMNPDALAILEQYQLPIVAYLAKCTNKSNLQAFQSLNPTEQTYFMTQFAKRKSQIIELQQSKPPRP